MQALLTAFENRGFPVAATTEGIRINILDENLGFGIEESLKKIDHAISFTEQKLPRAPLSAGRDGSHGLTVAARRHQRFSDSRGPVVAGRKSDLHRVGANHLGTLGALLSIRNTISPNRP